LSTTSESNNVNRVFLELISPSDIAYVLELIKNGKGVWDQVVRMAANPHGGGEKKMCLLFTSGKGKKRLFGKCVWTRDGLEYFYMVESNWEKVYTSKKNPRFAVNGSIGNRLMKS
jgi:hypothetical protein